MNNLNYLISLKKKIMSTIIDQKQFDALKKKYNNKMGVISEMKILIKSLQTNAYNIRMKLYEQCTHQFERKCTMGGCYPEYEWICKYCQKSK